MSECPISSQEPRYFYFPQVSQSYTMKKVTRVYARPRRSSPSAELGSVDRFCMVRSILREAANSHGPSCPLTVVFEVPQRCLVQLFKFMKVTFVSKSHFKRLDDFTILRSKIVKSLNLMPKMTFASKSHFKR